MTLDEIKEGDRVLYIPSHAHGDRRHPDCEHGVVSSKNAVNVFVRYHKNGILQHTPQSTTPSDLVKA